MRTHWTGRGFGRAPAKSMPPAAAASAASRAPPPAKPAGPAGWAACVETRPAQTRTPPLLRRQPAMPPRPPPPALPAAAAAARPGPAGKGQGTDSVRSVMTAACTEGGLVPCPALGRLLADQSRWCSGVRRPPAPCPACYAVAQARHSLGGACAPASQLPARLRPSGAPTGWQWPTGRPQSPQRLSHTAGSAGHRVGKAQPARVRVRAGAAPASPPLQLHVCASCAGAWPALRCSPFGQAPRHTCSHATA